MLATLAIIYIISIGLALLLVPLHKFTEQDSPFITSLKGYNLEIILDIFNGIFIIAGSRPLSLRYLRLRHCFVRWLMTATRRNALL